MTANEMYKEINEAAKQGCVTCISGTVRKLNAVSKKIDRYEEFSKTDFEIGVIDKSRYEIEKAIIDHMRKSVRLAIVI